MKAIIVDDEPANVKNLTILLNKYCPQVEILGSSNNNQDALSLFEADKPHLIFLDIQLDNDTGFNLLKLLPKKDFEVIFVTAYDNYGIQAIKFAALDYILKPIDIDELIFAVNKAEVKLKEKQKTMQLDFLVNHIKRDHAIPLKIALPQQKEIIYVLLTNIVRCEAEGTYTFFYLQNGEKILVSKVLKEYAELLENNGFIKTHQSHLVNLTFVKSWLKEDGGMLLLETGKKIPISRPHKDKVKHQLTGSTL
ncbi:LytTR family DNA-binding domain-containing protein [Pedobacter gandavensis]|uniref:LytR/AlgR family response regulator transcription factor n=1 Tax=Pedobacter gandavensis TaxID=2679963 RepID=UPI0029301EAA|nr:LytTR family DNA-binding domain-containing protein [Pedobacter gandavensis]